MRRRDFLRTAFLAANSPLLVRCSPPGESLSQIPLSSFDPQILPLLEQMTLAEKIGQMTQGELGNIQDESDIETYFLGSVLSGGGADPAEGNGLEAWTDTVDRLIARSIETRLGIPILYGVDAVHGHSNVLDAVIFPHNIGLGCTRNPNLVERIARMTAEEVRATGIQWTFAPCVTVPQDERWGRTYEGFSEDPAVVAQLGAAAVRGFQRGDLSDPLAILACAKHYVGDGGTTWGPRGGRGGRGGRMGMDQGDTEVDEATLRRVHLPGYVTAIEAGVGSIMPSYSSWNGEKVTGVSYLLTDLLKGELGFEGFLISDYNAIGQVNADFPTAVMMAINAGIDMAMEPSRYRTFIQTLTGLVEDGRVSMSRIDDAVTRILRVKARMGLLDPDRRQLADRTLHAGFGSPAHRDVARQAVRESLVLLKNARGTLPLSRTAARIHVAGRSAEDIGNQCGGWTVEWQGRSGDVTTGGTTLLAAIRARVSPETEVSFSVDGAGAEGATLAVAVVGETPYAEGVGDRGDLGLDPLDIATIDNLKAAGIPLVVVLVSGRPMILGDVLERADALIAAWLPGTEGQGVADVLFGDAGPTGKLSFTWPRSMEQIPINAGDAAYDPLFPLGFGLEY